ncbi:Putative transmembrane protein (modular protein) [Candidatus Sulfopaludibacter sp. SbA3]|nr:Putative transmembrane protein (modular protein) [Candidatus Sulfopaludibacter sp. SbA3]
MREFPIHTAAAILTFGLLLGASSRVLPSLKSPRASQVPELVGLSGTNPPLVPWSRRVEPEPAALPSALPGKTAAPQPLLDDSSGALDRFYQALWRTEKREDGAVTRIVHYGDSPTTADLITGDVRTMLHKRYGDAGHGFVLIAKPWAWYQHAGVQIAGSGWQMAPASRFESRDGLFGLGGVSFSGGASAHSRITWDDRGNTRFEVWFLKQPGGGAFTFSADGGPAQRVETDAAGKSPAFAEVNAASGAAQIDLRVDNPPVRLFGILAEKPGPGVVYDSLGLNGASVTVLTRMFNQNHWTEQLRHRDPQLLIINYGTNEADFAGFVDKGYEKELREAIRRAHAALPDASILVMSPMDRGYKAGAGEIETMPTIPRILAIQRRVARETGCGFFDTFAAMGGDGTMARWYAAHPRLVSADLIHPYPAGGKMIANVFVRELAAGLNRYKLRQTQTQSRRMVR